MEKDQKIKNCENCELFTLEMKNEGSCQKYPFAVVRKEGTCKYHKMKKEY